MTLPGRAGLLRLTPYEHESTAGLENLEAVGAGFDGRPVAVLLRVGAGDLERLLADGVDCPGVAATSDEGRHA